jgi:hypothetical protein
MRILNPTLLFILACVAGLSVFAACAGDDDDDNDSSDDDLNDDASDDDVDDDANDDVDDDADDDADDDDLPDDYVAPWPQSNIEVRDYDESDDAGPTRVKTQAYDEWHRTWHQPDYGCNVHAYFTDENYTDVTGYHGHGDSCIWTGTYLGAQSFRYWVTGDEQAKQIAMEMVLALDKLLHVNARPGFISRYVGSQDSITYAGDDGCDSDNRCHRIEDGEFAGDWWIGETSRDQYTGWFYGMAMAFDLIDDEPTKQIIRDDVTEVLDELLSTGWWIIDEAGEPTDAAPNVLSTFRLSWITIGYHITGLERFKVELQKALKNSQRLGYELSSIALFNRYMDYFGNNLAHTNWYNILRLGKVYYGEDDYAYMVDLFNHQVHTFTRLSHNPWFNGIYMSQGGYEPTPGDEYQTQLEDDLAGFRDPPLGEYYVPVKDPSTYTLDPLSILLSELQEAVPLLDELMGTVYPQALHPFPVDQYCPAGFMFQWSPFNIRECGADNPTKVHSGHDYLTAYWIAAYHKFIPKDQ